MNLPELLADAVRLLTRYVVMPSEAATAIALWIAHAHAFDVWDATPYLSVTSPEKRSGKTRTLEVLAALVPRPWSVVRPSEAVLFRKIERDRPTILLDEVDAIFRDKSETSEGLRALLNAGNRRGAVVPRCQGKAQALRDFSVYCPKVLAGIGALPDTVGDRSIPIRLARRKPGEAVARLRARTFEAEAAPARASLTAWAAGAMTALRGAEPDVPEALHDRAADAWEPLLAVADLAGGEWPRRAARSGPHAPRWRARQRECRRDASARYRRDLHRAACGPHLHARAPPRPRRAGRPWGAWWGPALEKGDVRGPGFRLPRLLRPYGLAAKTIRVGDERGKGFERTDFADSFSRYLNDVTTGQPAPDAGFSGAEGRDAPEAVTSPEGPQPVAAQGLSPRHVVRARGENGTPVSRAALLPLAEERGFPQLLLRPGVSVPAGKAAWGAFSACGTPEDVAAAWAALAEGRPHEHE